MPLAADETRPAAPLTIFDTDEWVAAWSHTTVERFGPADGFGSPTYLVEYSPFWEGYATDASLESMWDRPLLTVGSLYWFYGPSYLADSPDLVGTLIDRAREEAAHRDAAGVLVANLSPEAARQWAATRPPDASLRLDVAYWRQVGTGTDCVVGNVSGHVRTDWRRRWRRATELGLHLVEEPDPVGERVEEVIGLANASAVRHGWPPVYDRPTVDRVLALPAARLIRAEWSEQTVAGFVALEHDHRLYLWAGGTHQTLLREVSPYLFLLYELLAMGSSRGWDRVEFGRGNDGFKRKYGFSGTELWSLWYAGRDGDLTTVYPARLASLHERLGKIMGL